MCEYIKRILIIENREDIQQVLKLSIKMAASWEVLIASSGYEGIALAQTARPDAILLDASMPDTDGLMTLQLLKTNPSTQSIPIIAIAESARCGEQYYFKNLGVTAVVPQLFNPVNLPQQIAKSLNWC